MSAFIDAHREAHGVDPICRALQVAPSSYYRIKAQAHHSDKSGQYLSIRYTARLFDAGVDALTGSVGDPYDNALAETINGLYKAEIIRQRSSWRNLEEVEWATLEWVD